MSDRQSLNDALDTKRCGTCGETKPREAFGRDSRAVDGRRFRCRECRKRHEIGAEIEFWSMVERGEADECWTWLGPRTRSGYGLYIRVGRLYRAHRYSLSMASGGTPQNLDACHTCDNPPCCNPAHLYWGTEKDNARDMVQRGRDSNSRKTHCPKGHPYTPENTNTSLGYRRCRACGRDSQRKRRAERMVLA